MRRNFALVCALLGVVSSLLMGSVLARTTDAFHSTGNEAETGAYVPPHDIQAALVPATATSCSGATYSTGSIGAILDATNIPLDTGAIVETNRLCIKNNGRGTGRVQVNFFSVTNTEVACSPGEADPADGNDSTCGTGPGELSSVLRVIWTPQGTNPAGCGSSSGAFATYSSFQTLVTTLAPGEVCLYRVAVGKTGSETQAQLFAAASDKVTWSMQFNLEDIPA